MMGPDGRPLFPMQPPQPRLHHHQSDMSELQKLVNMQMPPEERPPEMFGCPPPMVGLSPRGPAPPIPTAQPLPPHMGPQLSHEDASLDGHTPEDGECCFPGFRTFRELSVYISVCSGGDGLLDLESDLSQNALLKKLLATPRGKDGKLQVDFSVSWNLR